MLNNIRFTPGELKRTEAEVLTEALREINRLRYELNQVKTGKLPGMWHIPAKLTAVDANGDFTWVQVDFDETGEAEPYELPGGLFGSPDHMPARERNGGTIGSFPVYVELAFRSHTEDKGIVWEFDASASTASGDCILAGLRQSECLKVTSEGQEIYLEYDGGLSPPGWSSADTITYPGAGSPGAVKFWYLTGETHLSVDGTELLNCGGGCFTGGPLTGHTAQDSGTECAGSTFTVCVECSCCPIEGWDGAGYYCVEDTGPEDCIVQLLTEDDKCDDEIVICSGPYATLAEAQAVCGGVDPNVNCPGVPGINELQFLVETEEANCSCLDGVSGPFGSYDAGPPIVWTGTEIAPSTCPGDSGTNWTLNATLTCTADEFGVGTVMLDLHIESFGTSDCPVSLGNDTVSPTILVESPFMGIFNLTISGVAFVVTVTEV